MKDKIRKAIDMGYSQEEIVNYLKDDKDYGEKVTKAIDAGYSPKDVVDYYNPMTGEDKLKENLRKPGAVVKGMAKEFSKIPKTLANAPTWLVKQLLRDSPIADHLEDVYQKRAQKEDWLAKTVEDRLESKFTTREEERPYEEGGERLAGNIAMGIDPVSSLLMSGSGQLAKEGGLGPLGQAGVETASLGLKGLAKKGFNVVKAMKAPVAEMESGLLKYKKPKKILGLTPTATSNRIKSQINKQLDIADEKVSGILKKRFPETEQQGGALIEEARKVVDKNKFPIDEERLFKQIQNKKESYYGKGIAPSNEEKDIIKALDEAQKDLNRTYSKKGSIFPSDLEKTYRTTNKNAGEAYRRAIPTERDYVTRASTEVLNDIYGNALKEEMGNSKKFNKLFDKGNEIYSTERRLADFKKLSDEWTTVTEVGAKINPMDFKRVLNQKTGFAQAKRSLGKEGANQLRTLANDLGEFSKNINGVKEFAIKNNLGSLLAFIPKIVPYGGLISVGGKVYMAKKGIEAIMGYIFTSPERAKILNTFIKSANTKNVSKMMYYGNKLNKILEDADKE